VGKAVACHERAPRAKKKMSDFLQSVALRREAAKPHCKKPDTQTSIRRVRLFCKSARNKIEKIMALHSRSLGMLTREALVPFFGTVLYIFRLHQIVCLTGRLSFLKAFLAIPEFDRALKT
jgi:hypothetical protein